MSTENADHTLTSSGAAAPPARRLPQGSRIDRYVVLELLGQGGMGAVYKAFDPKLNRGVALKLIRTTAEDHGQGGDRSPRLLREAQALAQLNHPNVVRVHDVGIVGENVFVAMELVEGRTLKAWHQESKPSTAEVLEVMRAAGRGLAAAHRQGLIHRDFKPDNVIVGTDGRVRVIDFGLARAADIQPLPSKASQRDLVRFGAVESRLHATPSPQGDDSSESRPALSSSGSDLLSSRMISVGRVVGTPAYMAPEQHLHSTLDAATDQFSFCVVLYEILYDRFPFRGRSSTEIRKEVVFGRVRQSPAKSEVPEWLHSIILRGLSPGREKRYPSMEVLLEELREDPVEVRRRQRTARKRKLSVIGSMVMAVMVPLGIWYGLRVRSARLCRATRAELGGVWDRATKDAVRNAFFSTDKPYAADTWQRVERAFDSYTAQWTQMRAEVCESRWLHGTETEGVFDLRMKCLSERLKGLSALVGVFAQADVEVLTKAAQASSSLTVIALCADEEALRAPYAPPRTPEAKAKVETIRRTLANVWALERTRKYRDGLKLAKRLMEAADIVGYRPVQAEVLQSLGHLLKRTGEYQKAETTLYEAALAAAESRASILAAKALALLVPVVGYIQMRHEEGLLIARHAEVILSVAGGDDTVRSLLLNNLGVLFYAKGGHDTALEYFRRSLAIEEKVRGPEHPDVARTLGNVGIIFWHKGEYNQALEYYRKSLAVYEKALGAEHPDVARSLNNIGTVFHRQAEYDKALEYYRRTLAVREKSLGPEHPDVAWSLVGIGEVHLDQEQAQHAIGPLERALAICAEKTCGASPHGAGLFSLARALVATAGDATRATRLARQAREVIAKAPYLDEELAEVNAWLQERGVE